MNETCDRHGPGCRAAYLFTSVSSTPTRLTLCAASAQVAHAGLTARGWTVHPLARISSVPQLSPARMGTYWIDAEISQDSAENLP